MANTEWEKVYQIKGLPIKFVWRGNPYNDLKATVEGGNRDYVSVGRIIASVPISQAEAEKLASAKWRQIKETARNANAARSTNSIVAKALNAVARNYDVKPGWTNRWSGELKPGTKITVVDSPMRYGGMAGEVVRRDGSRYVVRLDDIAGMEVQLNPNQISVKNAATGIVSEKAVNAKFKVGDRVKYVGSKYGAPYGKVLTIVKEPDNLGRYIIHWDSDHSGFMAVGSDGFAYEDELVLANARACNADFNVGDRVRI
ncbi:MAG: hypothetical protein IIZ06_07945, partial [Kiritimatiellae bacterium]|nr:hypothetical protein [Kiritimatiellia bacterium]